MSTRSFTIADTHFEHDKILAFCRPQFRDLDDMAETIVYRWNNVVKPGDYVYHLGDVAICGEDEDKKTRAGYWLEQLNGIKVLIAGNHDSSWVYKYFQSVFGARERKRCLLTHVPIHPSQHPRFRLNIHGHLHDYYIGDGEIQDPFYYCASVEQQDYAPRLISEIMAERL